MGKTKVIHKMYAAWDYGKEAEALNQESQKGWQLVKAGSLSRKFEEDHTVEYRYQLDYNPSVDDKKRYVDTFLEQGWEYICSTFNGWYYFRKKYDSELPSEEYEIYTDIPGKQEIAERWKNNLLIPSVVFMGILLVVCIFRAIQSFEFSRLGIIFELAVFEFILLYIIKRMRQAKKGIEGKGNIPIGVMFTLGVVGYILFIVLCINKSGTELTADIMVNGDTQNSYNTVWVKYPDVYYMDLEVSSDVVTTVSILDENEDVVYMQQGKEFKVSDHRMLLKRGTYKIHIDYDKTTITDGEEKSSYVSYDLN